MRRRGEAARARLRCPPQRDAHARAPRASRPQVFAKCRVSDAAIDLCAAMLAYEPQKRITAAAALLHPFFDELRTPGARLPDGGPLPPLFALSDEERKLFTPEQLDVLVPPHARAGAAAGAAAGASARASAPQTARSDATMTLSSPTPAAAAVAGAGAGSAAPLAPPTPAAAAAGGPASARLHPNSTVSATSTSARTGAGATAPPTRRGPLTTTLTSPSLHALAPTPLTWRHRSLRLPLFPPFPSSLLLRRSPAASARAPRRAARALPTVRTPALPTCELGALWKIRRAPSGPRS